MNKPLKDWTLWELKEYCDTTDCEDCEFHEAKDWRYRCALTSTSPAYWNLSDPSCWTAEDIADAKAVKRLFPYVVKIKKIAAFDIQLINSDSGFLHYAVGRDVFPHLAVGETVDLQEILDAEGKESGQTDF